MLFKYRIPDSGTYLFARNKDDIIKTLEYYKNDRGQSDITLPAIEEIDTADSVELPCFLPLYGIHDDIGIELTEDFSLVLNANAYQLVKKQADTMDERRRAALYKFKPTHQHLAFIPEDVAIAMKNYDWDMHAEKVEAILEKRERDLDDAEQRGYLYRCR